MVNVIPILNSQKIFHNIYAQLVLDLNPVLYFTHTYITLEGDQWGILEKSYCVYIMMQRRITVFLLNSELHCDPSHFA